MTLTELVEFVQKLDEKMKSIIRETKENVQGTNSDGKETGTQINGVDQREETKVIVSEIKKILQGTNNEGKEAGIQINDLEHKEEINIQTEQKEQTRIQKNKDSIRRL